MIMDNNFNIGERVRTLRIQQGFSQEQLALRAEITTTYLGMIERNAKNPTIKIVEQLCNAFNITLGEFFDNSPKDSDDPDTLSVQILAQLHNRTIQEKEAVLQIIKKILNFRDMQD